LSNSLDSSKIDFIQIGANIGQHGNDPIYPLVIKKGWRGLFVEPLPHSFDKLRKCYKNISGCYFEMVAISNVDGYVDFNWCEQDESQQASMFKSFADNIKHCKVSSMKLETLCEKYNLIGVPFKLLQIDAEGADGLILWHTDLKERVIPEYIRFETCHVGKHYSPTPTLGEVYTHLGNAGYQVVDDIFEHRESAPKLDVLFRRLKCSTQS